MPPSAAPSVAAAVADDGDLPLADYARRAYLEYALSVVKGRALPDVTDGQKPVQRRILYVMGRMGLGYGGAAGNTPATAVKSARVVGDVLGKFHPHGDSAAYEALVRMAQGFSQRYPLIDGQGNFGSRDGDAPAAMRYTEARLAKITRLLLDEIDEGTVDFVPNYDGRESEPAQLPARLPFALLNGASGIAVGLACEIPSHNLREVADACVALLKNPQLDDDALFALLPGPDYPGGGQIISAEADIREAYRSGRGSLKVRARWKVEELARGQWQMVVTELPPGTSTQRVMEEIEDIFNPKVKAGKKALTPEQNQLKASMQAVLDEVRDESDKDAPVRIVLSPKSRSVAQADLAQALLAHTSLEGSAPINLTSVGLDGRPVQKSLRQMLAEWIEWRQRTIARRSGHKLQKVLERIHILEGRQLVLLNIDEVIAIIRESDEPRAALIARFGLTERQADDILDIRLRQLARLEAIKIEQELAALRSEQAGLQEVLDNPAVLRRLMAREIEADARQFADARRTLIQPEKKAVAEVRLADEPVTVVISAKGWVRARQGHGHDPAAFAFKAGDGLYATFECRSVDHLLTFGSNGRVYTTPVASLPGARGDGQPITTLVELEAGSQPVHYLAAADTAVVLLSQTGGYGFLAQVGHMLSRQRGGKAFITLGEGERICRPALVHAAAGGLHAKTPPPPAAQAQGAAQTMATPASGVACVSSGGRLLTFGLDELKVMEKGGRGLTLMALEDGDSLAGACAYSRSVRIDGVGRGGKPREETLEIRSLNNARAARGRKGRDASFGFKPQGIVRIE